MTFDRRLYAAVAIALAVAVAVLVFSKRAYFSEVAATIEDSRIPIDHVVIVPTAERLGVYYAAGPEALATEVTDEERERLQKPWMTPVDEGSSAQPVAVAQQGLRDMSRYVRTNEPLFLAHAKSAGDLLLDLQHKDGGFRYDFAYNDLPVGWRSSMAQGQAISLFARLAQETGDDRYLDAAWRAYEFMMTPADQGGTLGTFGDGSPVPEEYVDSAIAPHVLNGAIYSAWGVRDLALATGDPEVGRTWLELASALVENVDLYDTGSWTRYSLREGGRDVAVWRYHRTHIVQARVMYALTGDERWDDSARRWEGYRRALAGKPVRVWWQDFERRLDVVRYGEDG